MSFFYQIRCAAPANKTEVNNEHPSPPPPADSPLSEPDIVTSSAAGDEDDLMEAVQRIERQAALSAAVNPWCYPGTSNITSSILFGLQGTSFMMKYIYIYISFTSPNPLMVYIFRGKVLVMKYDHDIFYSHIW